jgi:DNA-binding PadR family transcriptional regulator
MTNAELAILSLIAEGPRHGYEIEQVIEARGMREWTEVGFSSIYYLLRKLEQDGLVEGQIERQTGRGPARKVYDITPAGEEALHSAVLDALSVPHPCYSPLQLGLANLPRLSQAETLAALRQYRDSLAARLEHVGATRESQQPLPYFVEAMFDHSITMIEAELKWITQFMLQLADQAGQ